MQASNDTTVVPHASESHGFYAWGGTDTVVPLRESEGYVGDYIGLQSLDAAGKLKLLAYPGEHMQFSADWWAQVVLPHLGP